MQNRFGREGATLEPLPSLRCIYIAPSMKVLFPQNQYKASFKKFTAVTIKRCNSQHNKNTFHNISNQILTEKEFSVLTKGLSFAPTPTKTFKREITISSSNFFPQQHLQKATSFQEKSNWIPCPSDNHTLVHFFTSFEQGLSSTNTPRQKTYKKACSNLTLKEKKALKKIKSIQFIVMKPRDKGGGICIMNKRDCLTKIHI